MTTYATLLEDLADWLVRDDLASRIPTFIRLAEAKMNRKLRIRALEETATIAITAQEGDLPNDFQKMISVEYSDEPLTYVTRNVKVKSLSNCDYTTIGTKILVGPNVDSVDIQYYKSVPAINDTDPTTNWILTNAYDVYLNGCLMIAQPYLMEDKRTELFATLFIDQIEELQKSDKKDKLGEGPLIRKPLYRNIV